MPADELPEGTDAIVNGAGVDARDEDDADALDDAADAIAKPDAPARTGTGGTALQASAAAHPDQAAQSFASRIEGLKGQAGERARDFVEDAKARATDGIDDVVRMIHEAADEVDAKVGSNYGDYIRRAAGSVSGVSDTLKGKDADALFADARELIAKAPGVAIGAAAAIGFVIARLARAGVAEAGAAPRPEHKAA